MYRFIATMTAMAALAGFALGCGSSDDETASAAAPLSRAEFIKQGNAACAKVAKEAKADLVVLEKAFARRDRREGVDPYELTEEGDRVNLAVKKIVAPAMRLQVEALEELTPPDQDQAVVDRMIQRFSRASDVMAKEGWEGVSKSRLSTFQEEAKTYGLESCTGLIY